MVSEFYTFHTTGVTTRPARPLGWWIGLLLLLAASGAQAQELSDQDYMDGFGPRLSKIAERATAARTLPVDTSTFFPKSVAASVSRRQDPQAAFFFVRDKIAFEPYEGAQRGLTGTLMARSGNSIDQAMLLRSLLDEYKIKSRLAHGKLSADDKTRLLRNFSGTGELVGNAPETMNVYDPAKDRVARRAVEDHYWVEAYIEGQWVHLDPSFSRAVFGVPVATKSTNHDDLPPEAAVNISVKVYALESNGGGGEVLNIKRPMDAMIHRNMVLRFKPYDRAGTQRVPNLKLGKDTIEGNRMRWSGLERLWVEFYFERGGKVRGKITRDLHLKGGSGGALDTDQQVFNMMILPSWMPDDFLKAVAAQEMPGLHNDSLQVRKTLEKEFKKAAQEREVGPHFAAYVADILGRAGGLVALTYATVTAQVAINLGIAHGVRPYYDAPRIIVVSGVRHKDRLYWQLDLRQNDIKAIPAEGAPLLMAQAFQAARGHFDSQFGAAVLSSLTGKPTQSVSRIVNTAIKAKTPLVTLDPGNIDKTLDDLKLSEEARDRLSNAVRKRGNTVLVPTSTVKVGDEDATAWWELDKSGAINGVRADGARGSSQFSAAIVAKNQGAGPRPGGMRILVFDEALTLVDHLAKTVVTLLRSAPNVCAVVCATGKDLKQLPKMMCTGDREPAPANVKACLQPEKPSDDILGMTLTCSARVKPTRCGAMMANGVLSGRYRVQYTTAPTGSITGPWEQANLPAVSFGACGCNP